MSVPLDNLDVMPVVADIRDFDKHSGNFLERLIFNHRAVLIIFCTLICGFSLWQITRLSVNASFEKMIPTHHPYIVNYLANKDQLRGLGNSLRVVVESTDGTIFNAEYLETLKKIHDDLFLTPGVDRAWIKSLWAAGVRWNEVTETGFSGGPIIPDNYDGSPSAIEEVRLNIARAGILGSLVGNDAKSSMVFLPLQTHYADGTPINYRTLSHQLEDIRSKYQSAKINVRIIGFAKLVGDLIDGLYQVMIFFALAAFIALMIIYIYTRCLRSTFLVVACSLIAVIWQLGIITFLGFDLDPYSILVPFLVFAIGVSHGAQKMNGIMQDIGRGTHRQVAARYTFRRLFLAGVTALLADAVGFAVLMVIDIPVIKDLALTASIGVAVLVFTNLLLLPVLLSYIGVSPVAARMSLREIDDSARGWIGRFWQSLEHCTTPIWAKRWVMISGALLIFGFAMSTQLKIGDLDPGAPELRAQSRYNQDNGYINAHYALSSDVFAVIVKTPPEGCATYETLTLADRLGWQLQQLPSVQATQSLVGAIKQISTGSFEGNIKWMSLSRNQEVINYATQQATVNNPDLFDTACSVMPVIAYLSDHKAETLAQVVAVAENFAQKYSQPDRQFLLAAGSSGIEAATNKVVKKSWWEMLLMVYTAVMVLCFITFRSWRAVVVAVVPLVITSVLCEALMVLLGIGVKVATLPVIALGVGIGVDYALYLLSVQLAQQRKGLSLAESYRKAVMFTGKVVALVGITLAAGVMTWIFSPIKFQADMGILLTFMFLWNMFGALIMIPALSHYLLKKVT